MNFKKILQLQPPKADEPMCSGFELTMARNERLDLAHFHTVVTIKNTRARQWLMPLASSDTLSLDCSVTINGRQYENQQFEVRRDDIGKTLFCAGFPCITITGVDSESGKVTVTMSEIVVQCAPDSCPWG